MNGCMWWTAEHIFDAIRFVMELVILYVLIFAWVDARKLIAKNAELIIEHEKWTHMYGTARQKPEVGS